MMNGLWESVVCGISSTSARCQELRHASTEQAYQESVASAAQAQAQQRAIEEQQRAQDALLSAQLRSILSVVAVAGPIVLVVAGGLAYYLYSRRQGTSPLAGYTDEELEQMARENA